VGCTTDPLPTYKTTIEFDDTKVSRLTGGFDVWWIPPPLTGTTFPMGINKVVYLDSVSEMINVEVIVWSGHWWEVGTDLILCADSFYIKNASGGNIKVNWYNTYDTTYADTLGDTWRGYSDSAVTVISSVVVY